MGFPDSFRAVIVSDSKHLAKENRAAGHDSMEDANPRILSHELYFHLQSGDQPFSDGMPVSSLYGRSPEVAHFLLRFEMRVSHLFECLISSSLEIDVSQMGEQVLLTPSQSFQRWYLDSFSSCDLRSVLQCFIIPLPGSFRRSCVYLEYSHIPPPGSILIHSSELELPFMVGQ